MFLPLLNRWYELILENELVEFKRHIPSTYY